MPSPLVLASTSPFRRQLLEKLGLPFETAAPDIDESRRPGEPPEALVKRLSLEKARAVAAGFPDALIIGSDQVACLDEQVLGKPGDFDRAFEQLSAASGKRVSFLTGLCLLNSATGQVQILCEPFHVHFRNLSPHQIENYLNRERPFNCAGSFKSEALGIALFERLEGDDPNSLIGLPLIRLIAMLEKEGASVI
ncbi:MAG: septum formation inhibitor Maf [Gammaproteobacteria bacterium]|nr:septum formation inhibitor Maf [Gammaproteobacteria bacterium]MBU1655776.1 septum formation inhibitor Maf [Gammaproteobacteria bacterium]MBU1961130.1 septum formation inhibitor Maf [Gammaproteobacteria bacterium]